MRFANDGWDPLGEEKFWRETLKAHGAAVELLSAFTSSRFYLNLLAELDAAARFTRPECFISRAGFVAELRRLLMEPPAPSHCVPNVEEYQRVQRTVLESTIKKYDGAGYI